jgi:hypothetical protein
MRVSEGVEGVMEPRQSSLTIRSSQKIFTEEEVSGLTGICLEHLRSVSRLKHLGQAAEAAAVAAGSAAQKWLYSTSDLMVLTMVCGRCEH